MDTKEERLVARLRHHNPTLTVTDINIGRVDRFKKKQVIHYLYALKLNPNVESSPGLETVVSIDISSRSEQNEVFNKLLTFFHDIGIGDVSITSEPFDDRQPEIESTDSIQVPVSLLKDFLPLNSEDTDELISRDKSESEFELILSRPWRSSSRESTRIQSDQSSKDVIGSLLKVGEVGRSQISDWSLPQPSGRNGEHWLKYGQFKPHQRIQNIWSRAKKMFIKKRRQSQLTVEQFQFIVSKDSINSELGKSREKHDLKGGSILRDTGETSKRVRSRNQVVLNSLQKRLEKVSRDVFNMKSKCPGMMDDGQPLDAYTQTPVRTPEADRKDMKCQTVYQQSESNETAKAKIYIAKKKRHSSAENNQGGISDSSESETENQTANSGVQRVPPPLRGMVTNLIPLYPNVPADLKQPVLYQLKPVGGPFFFRRITATKTSPHITGMTTSSIVSTRSSATTSFLSTLSGSREPFAGKTRASCKNIVNSCSKEQYIKCGVMTTQDISPFERKRPKKIQTSDTPLTAADTNTSGVFKLPKITQTNFTKQRKSSCHVHKVRTYTFGTQTSSCSNSTSCTELLGMKSCGTKTENGVEKVDRENSCHLLSSCVTEKKEAGSETGMFKCDSCLEKSSEPAVRKRKAPGRQKIDKAVKRGFGWGQFPDGNFGFGHSYAPGKVVPIVSLAQGFSVTSPFAQQAYQKVSDQACPKICNLFTGKKRAIMEELKKQRLELLQLKLILVALNEEILIANTDTSSDENVESSDENSSFAEQLPQKLQKKVTFREPLIN